ncbi:HEPN domain protein [Halothece sp. PCC 7418]|uniref:HEPN domain-containing protein n=1 Tax=Halothece sp. (strain PCC 7418) TaxID=65093 RepID=UPI0002A065D0|nr:HEPN domain-containing protein [Halothece sp. PCC 7418]AFZ44469.1 HEPN domain protein [Halothece sp. PCC 7418]
MKQQEWNRYLKQAKHTLASARRDCTAEDFDWACFKAHQAGELILKGWLRSTDHFVTGHSIVNLLEQLKPEIEVPPTLQKCARELDKVYIPSRYPDAYIEGAPIDFYDQADAGASIDCVEKILEFIENLANHAR